jgi:hypothetical protein
MGQLHTGFLLVRAMRSQFSLRPATCRFLREHALDVLDDMQRREASGDASDFSWLREQTRDGLAGLLRQLRIRRQIERAIAEREARKVLSVVGLRQGTTQVYIAKAADGRTFSVQHNVKSPAEWPARYFETRGDEIVRLEWIPLGEALAHVWHAAVAFAKEGA